jgi:hypothetical protein
LIANQRVKDQQVVREYVLPALDTVRNY